MSKEELALNFALDATELGFWRPSEEQRKRALRVFSEPEQPQPLLEPEQEPEQVSEEDTSAALEALRRRILEEFMLDKSATSSRVEKRQASLDRVKAVADGIAAVKGEKLINADAREQLVLANQMLEPLSQKLEEGSKFFGYKWLIERVNSHLEAAVAALEVK